MTFNKHKRLEQLTSDDFDFKIACVTGQMAAGKNYVSSKMAEKFDCLNLDLDKTVHKVIKKLEPEILTAFSLDAKKAGINLLLNDGSLNRGALGALIFTDKLLIQKQENLVYPQLIEETKAFIKDNNGKKILLNAALLYKTPELLNLCEKIFFVRSSFLKRLLRAKKRDGLPFLQILKRFKAQKKILNEYKKTKKQIVFIKN